MPSDAAIVGAMNGTLLADAFGHHTWATIRIVDACLGLDPDQLKTSVPGTYGSILDTTRHLVGADAWYLYRITRGRLPEIDEDHMDLAQLRVAAVANSEAWPQVLAGEIDPDEIFEGRNSDGSITHAAAGIRLAQALHHGTDHRSQICTALTTLGIEPPAIDVWDYGQLNGRVVEEPAPA
jgi:uncharacterized damage-inducible protein DinB